MARNEIKEWHHQDSLSRQWRQAGLTINGTNLFFCAYETQWLNWLMNDWKRIKRKEDKSESADFLFLNREGQVWVIEYKKKFGSRGQTEDLLYQVTHCAALYAETFSYDYLNYAYLDGFRIPQRNLKTISAASSVRQAHQTYFELPEPLPESDFGKDPFERVIAGGIVRDVSEILKDFANREFKLVTKQLYEKFPRKNINALADEIWSLAIARRANRLKSMIHVLDCLEFLKKDPPRLYDEAIDG